MKLINFKVAADARLAAENQLKFFNKMMEEKKKSGHVSTSPISARALKLKSDALAAAKFQLRFFEEMMSKKNGA